MTRSGQADRFDRAKFLERAFHEGKGIDEDGLPGDLDSVRVAPEVDPVIVQTPVQDAGSDGLDLSGSIPRLRHGDLYTSGCLSGFAEGFEGSQALARISHRTRSRSHYRG